MVRPVGGRGYKSPTVPMRVPPDLKQTFEKFKDAYYETGAIPLSAACDSDNTYTSLEKQIELARSVLKQKKSASKSLAIFLSKIHNREITPESLI